MKRKLLAGIISSMLALSLAACGSTTGSSDSTIASNSDSVEAASSTMASLTDSSLNGSSAGKYSSSEKAFRVGIEMKTLDGAYFTALNTHVTDACKALGWEVNTLNADSDTLKEAENIDSFIAQDYDLIFMDPYDTEGCVAAINKAADSGIPVICMDNSPGDSANVVTNIESDSLQNGRAVGKWVAENCFEPDELISSVLIAGQKGVYVGEQRRTGIMCGVIEARTGCSEDEAWEKAKELNNEAINNGSGKNQEANFEICGVGWGEWTSNGGLDAAEDLLAANPDINFLFGENDAMVMGAMTAVENAGKSDDIILAAAADGQKEAYKLIKDGTNYKATGENNPKVVAEYAVDVAKQVLIDRKEPSSFERSTVTPANCINPDNVDEFYDPDSLF